MKKNILIIICLSLLVFSSCDRYIESKDPVRSLPDDVSVPKNINLFIDNLAVTLTWDIDNPSSISKYRVYVSENDTLNYQLEDSSTTQTITLDELITNRLYFFKLAAVNTSGLEGHRSEELFAQVGILSLVINNNSKYTNRRSVNVQFTVSNSASNALISEDSTFSDVVYLPFSGQSSYTLSDGDGTKRVYARLLFTNGATSQELLQDSIILDTEATIDSVFFLNPNNLYAPGDTIVFGLIAGELNGTASVSFTGSGSIKLVDDGTGYDTVADDGIYYGRYVVPNNTNVHNATVNGNFSDEAGNNAPVLSSYNQININTAPDAIELLVAYTPGDSAYFSWTRSDEPDFESYRLYSATHTNVLTSDNLLTYESSAGNRQFTIMPPVGTTRYRIFVYDVHGQYSTSNEVQVTRP